MHSKPMPSTVLVLTSSPHPVVVDEFNQIRKRMDNVVFLSLQPFTSLLRCIIGNAMIILPNIRLVFGLKELIFSNLGTFPLHHLIYWYMHTLYILVLDKKKSIGIIHAHWLYPAGLIATTYSKYMPKKVIISTHGYDADERTFGKDRMRNLFFKVAPNANWIITANEEFRRFLFAQGLTNVVLTNYFVDLDKFDSPLAIQQSKEYLGIDKGSFVVLFGPHLEELYGIADFAEAVVKIHARIKNLMVICLGDGSLRKMAEDLFKKYGIRNVFTGNISNADVVRYLQSCDVFCYPCSTGHGISVLEAFACKKPIVAYSVKLFVVQNNITGLLADLGDIDNLAKSILRLYEDEELRVRLGENGRRELDSKYTKQQRIADVLNCYSSS